MTEPNDAQPCDSEDPDASKNADASGEPPVVSSSDLLAGHRELLIAHGDELYRLRITRNGKLILHK